MTNKPVRPLEFLRTLYSEMFMLLETRNAHSLISLILEKMTYITCNRMRVCWWYTWC